MLSGRALYYSMRLSYRIPVNPSLSWSDHWLWSCSRSWLSLPGYLTPSLGATECYRNVTTSSIIQFNRSQQVDSSRFIPDPICQLAVVLSFFFTCWQLQRCHCLKSYTIPFVYTSGFQWATCRHDPTAGWRAASISKVSTWVDLLRMIATRSYSDATASSLIPFNSSQWANSSESIPDLIRLLFVELLSFLTLAPLAPNTKP